MTLSDPRILGAFEARTRLAELLERVCAGESFVITRRGILVARLGPPHDPERTPATIKALIAAARRLRADASASRGELRTWVEEGRT